MTQTLHNKLVRVWNYLFNFDYVLIFLLLALFAVNIFIQCVLFSAFICVDDYNCGNKY